MTLYQKLAFLSLPVLIIVSALVLLSRQTDSSPQPNPQDNETPPKLSYEDPYNTSYSLDGSLVDIYNGHSQTTPVVDVVDTNTRVGDMDSDGDNDVLVLLKKENTYFLALAFADTGLFQGSNTLALPKTEAPQRLVVRGGLIIVDYADGSKAYAVYEEQVLRAQTYANADIVLSSVQAGDLVSSPITVSGSARGTWFFEGIMPVVITDWDGRIIAEAAATSTESWMTEDSIPFSAVLTFTATSTVSNRGSLIIKKSNPSDLPENDDALEIPIFFE